MPAAALTKVYFAIQKLNTDRSSLDEIDEKTHGFLVHRRPQVIVERRKALAIDGVVFVEAAEVEPISPKLSS